MSQENETENSTSENSTSVEYLPVAVPLAAPTVPTVPNPESIDNTWFNLDQPPELVTDPSSKVAAPTAPRDVRLAKKGDWVRLIDGSEWEVEDSEDCFAWTLKTTNRYDVTHRRYCGENSFAAIIEPPSQGAIAPNQCQQSPLTSSPSAAQPDQGGVSPAANAPPELLKVNDRVLWDNAPSHLAGWSPLRSRTLKMGWHFWIFTRSGCR